ncbi:MAG: helix-turn-helix domain-containing protein [Planctomycetes bacterium]|nr:helix-turn-helix domain-containing protein [Planctomycetota bacterium]
MKARRLKLSQQIRKAIDTSGLSRYRIAVETGLDHAAMSRFMADKGGLSVESLDAIADVLGLEVTAVNPRPVQPPKRPGRKRKAR